MPKSERLFYPMRWEGNHMEYVFLEVSVWLTSFVILGSKLWWENRVIFRPPSRAHHSVWVSLKLSSAIQVWRLMIVSFAFSHPGHFLAVWVCLTGMVGTMYSMQLGIRDKASRRPLSNTRLDRLWWTSIFSYRCMYVLFRLWDLHSTVCVSKTVSHPKSVSGPVFQLLCLFPYDQERLSLTPAAISSDGSACTLRYFITSLLSFFSISRVTLHEPKACNF